MEPFTNLKRVAVVGAGPAGLAAVKYLKDEQCFDKIVAFEQRDEVGGVWNYTGDIVQHTQPDSTVPRTRPADLAEQPVTVPTATGAAKIIFPSPIYDSLETNIPHTLMNYTDKPFPPNCPLFPPFAIVKQYLEEYSADIRDHIKLGSQISEIRPILSEDARETKWNISYSNLATMKSCEESFDAIVCASGHYSDPYIPDIPGISAFHSRYPGTISHSKYYRSLSVYANKKVIVVGNAASGVDISRQLSTATSHVTVSEKEKPAGLRSDPSTINYRPEIAEFIIENKTVRFIDGTVDKNIDHIIFCTGYQYSFPFLKGLEHSVASTGERTRRTFQHIFYYPQPTLAFLTLPQRIVPFPVAEAQAAYIARVFSGRLTLPDVDEMKAWESGVLQAKGSKSFHNLGFPEDAAYINTLYSLSMSATSHEGRAAGKIPPFWDEEKRWTRQQFPLIKQAALKLGDKRREVRGLKDLGFDFQAWKEQNCLQQKTGSRTP